MSGDSHQTHAPGLGLVTTGSGPLPRDIYRERNGFDPRFNADLQADLNSARRYYFLGSAGLYVPLRLRARPPAFPLSDVRVFIADPRDDAALQRVADFSAMRGPRRAPVLQDKPFALRRDKDEIELVRHDVLMSVVALFDGRSRSDVALGFHSMTEPDSRFELFDDCVYQAVQATRVGTDFPRMLCWHASHPAYEAALNFARQLDIEIRFTRGDEDEVLLELLRELEPHTADVGALAAELRADFETQYIGRRGQAISDLVDDQTRLRERARSTRP